MSIIILAIESSCDDTSCAILNNNIVLSNVTANQSIHEKFGGVVPELASRDHQKNIVPVVDAALKKAGLSLSQLNAIAVTSGPGLMGSLLVGLSFAKSLSLSLNIPLIEVNHMQAHILAHFIQEANHSLLKDNSEIKNQQSEMPEFPFLCLTVSGGHTQLIKVNNYLSFELMGETIDDAVGEAFDKAAKIIGLPYPGGPLIDKYAKNGNPEKYQFSTSHVTDNNFSFSGIKTSFLYFIQNNLQKDENFVNENLNDICASYQSHLIKTLLKKTKKVLSESGIKSLAIAGGVSANSLLRTEVKKMETEMDIKTFIPAFEYCTDNAAMIGVTAYYKFLQNQYADISVAPKVRMGI